jgi:hypothetical protein
MRQGAVADDVLELFACPAGVQHLRDSAALLGEDFPGEQQCGVLRADRQ